MSDEIEDPGSPGTEHRSLLGRLAWKAGLDEPFATDALAVLLEQLDIRSAFLDHLQIRLGQQGIDIDLRRITDMLPQFRDIDHGKPDIVGCDDQGHPILVIEAKFDHHLRPGQVISYLELQRRDVSSAQFALVLVVPKYRVGDATEIGRDAARQLGLDESLVLTVSWQEVLDVVESAAADLGAGHRSYSADAAQLRDLVEYRTHTGLEPVSFVLTDEMWDTSLPLYDLVNGATRRIDEITGTKRYPRQPIDPTGFGPFHYVPVTDRILYALGPHRTFASHGLGPLWLRFHKDTGNDRGAAEAIRSRLANNGGWALRDDWGHVWVPIEIEELGDDSLVDHVVGQVLDVLEIGLPMASGQGEDFAPST